MATKTMIIRSKSFKNWVKNNLKDYLNDITNFGCAGGFPGLTYYIDTSKLYDKFSDEIWDLAYNNFRECGYKNILEFVASFNGADQAIDSTTFKNLMVWYAAEEIARELTSN